MNGIIFRKNQTLSCETYLKSIKLNELSKTNTSRLAKLYGMLGELRRGTNVQNRLLASWLSADEYEQIAAEWDTQKHFRKGLKDKPSELKRYENKLEEGIMIRNRSDAYHRKGKKSAAYKLNSNSPKPLHN